LRPWRFKRYLKSYRGAFTPRPRFDERDVCLLKANPSIVSVFFIIFLYRINTYKHSHGNNRRSDTVKVKNKKKEPGDKTLATGEKIAFLLLYN